MLLFVLPLSVMPLLVRFTNRQLGDVIDLDPKLQTQINYEFLISLFSCWLVLWTSSTSQCGVSDVFGILDFSSGWRRESFLMRDILYIWNQNLSFCLNKIKVQRILTYLSTTRERDKKFKEEESHEYVEWTRTRFYVQTSHASGCGHHHRYSRYCVWRGR